MSLRDLYIAELRGLLDAEQHTLLELPSLAAAATSGEVRRFFEEHLEQTHVHAERLQLLLRKLGAADGAPSEAMHGLVKECRRRIAEAERGEVLDAALIGVAQRIEHYEIATYGCARTYAKTLGDPEAASVLQQTLDEEGAADERLTRLADRINQAAAEGLRPDHDAQRSRLRYLPMSALSDFKFQHFHVRNLANENLGRLDGLIVDTHTHRPEYFVVDSGGWFVGQRFIVPIDELRPDESTETLRTNLDRATIEAYPPFNAAAYLGPGEPDRMQADGGYRPPTWLMTGVWMTEASGFASVPPRAQSDFCTATEPVSQVQDNYPGNELLVARGEPEDRGEKARSDVKPPPDRKP